MAADSNTNPEDQVESVCGHCHQSITLEQESENFCPECKASYCDKHFSWSEWSYIHQVTETMIRYGTCPKGHKKEQFDS